jgi:hypothetical protein
MITCKGCGKDVDPLEVFPGDRCLDCHKVIVSMLPMPTADQIVKMWGGKS